MTYPSPTYEMVMLSRNPVADLEAVPKQYVDTFPFGSGLYLPISGGVMLGALVLAADPASNLQAATKQYVDAHSGTGGGAGYVPISGAAMTGPLTLSGDATLSLHAVPLEQLNSAIAAGPFLKLTGGTLSGPGNLTVGGTLAVTGTLGVTGTTTVTGLNKAAAADGDIKWTLSHNGFNSTRTDKNISSFAAYPAYFQYLNQCANFPGPFSGNYQQYTALYAQGFSGPTATGNTGALALLMTSHGMSPSSSYDIPLSIAVDKSGQSSTWGIVVDSQDFTGRIPQAFAQWNEFNIEGNGYDVPPWDPAYGKPQAGGRVNALFANKRMTQASWAAATVVSVKSTAQASATRASVIAVTASGTQYTWYCVQGGTTGGTQPTWPAPVQFVATLNGGAGTMAVTSVTSGALATNMYVSLGGTIATIQITGQTSGPAGGAGNYTVAVTGTANIPTAVGCYAAPRITDGSAIWAFGAHYNLSVSAGIYFSGTGLAMDVVVGGQDLLVTGAFLDTTQLAFGTGAAAIRIAPDQAIDFSGGSTVAARGKHFMTYSTFVASGALAYNGLNGTMFAALDPYGQFVGGTINLLPATVIAYGPGSDLSATNTGYDIHGLTIGRNRSTFQEVDFVTGQIGCAFINTDGSGVLQSAYAAMGPAGVTSTKGLGMWGTQASAVATKPVVTGAKTDLTSAGALKSLLAVLAAYGILTDSST
jgi:hypothetical protein